MAVLAAAFIGLFAWFTITSTVSANPGYTFTAPGNISFTGMIPRDSPYTGVSSGILTGDNTNGYTVTVVDTKSTNTGYMVSGANTLHNKLKIGPDAGSLADADIASTLLNTSGPATNVAVPLYISQKIDSDDAIAAGYTITITYTVIAK